MIISQEGIIWEIIWYAYITLGMHIAYFLLGLPNKDK